jgi:hypothetical protein
MELEYKEHPILEPPSDEEQLWMIENDTEAYLQSIQLHNDRIEASIVDPVYHSFVLPQQFFRSSSRCVRFSGRT